MKKAAIRFLMIAALLVLFTGCQREENLSAFRSEELEKYVIVYQQSNPDYFLLANQLSDRIYETYGCMLQVLPDVAAAPAEYEIVLGDTDRCQQPDRVMEYSVTVDDGKFLIHTGGTFSAEKAVDYLCESVFNGQELTLDNGQYYAKSFLTDAYQAAPGTTARIMSANILAESFAGSEYRKPHYRAEIFAGMLVACAPDVVGLQEADEGWNEVLDGYLQKLQSAHGITYSRYLPEYEGKVNYTSFLYRSDKYQVLDGGVAPFRWWSDPVFHHNYHMRNISWAKLSVLEDSAKEFIVANTHWSYRTEHTGAFLTGADTPLAENQLREQCMEETKLFLAGFKQTHPAIPIFMTGDFNTSLPYFTQYGWKPDGFDVISELAKSNGVARNAVPESGHYDHLFGAGSYEIGCYAYLQNTAYLQLLTDHPVVYADLAF